MISNKWSTHIVLLMSMTVALGSAIQPANSMVLPELPNYAAAPTAVESPQDLIPTDQNNLVPTDQKGAVPAVQNNLVPAVQNNLFPTDQKGAIMPTDQKGGLMPTDQKGGKLDKGGLDSFSWGMHPDLMHSSGGGGGAGKGQNHPNDKASEVGSWSWNNQSSGGGGGAGKAANSWGMDKNEGASSWGMDKNAGASSWGMDKNAGASSWGMNADARGAGDAGKGSNQSSINFTNQALGGALPAGFTGGVKTDVGALIPAVQNVHGGAAAFTPTIMPDAGKGGFNFAGQGVPANLNIGNVGGAMNLGNQGGSKPGAASSSLNFTNVGALGVNASGGGGGAGKVGGNNVAPNLNLNGGMFFNK